MQGGGDPFSGFGRHPFGVFGDFNGFGGFGGRSLMSGFYGGHDPFDDPFFGSSFGTIAGSGFSHSGGSLYPDVAGTAADQSHRVRHLRGPVIEELNSDDEEIWRGELNHVKEDPRKYMKSNKDPVVEDPDDEIAEEKIKHISSSMSGKYMRRVPSQPRSQSFTFQSSTVSYGCSNGEYYTSSRTRRSGSDGLLFDEFKEADSSTGEATHRVTRDIQDKGHSVTRKLTSSGHVNSMQTFHNLNEDELLGFNEAWRGNAPNHLPRYTNHGSGSISQQQRYDMGRYALPSSKESYKPDPANHRIGTGPSHSQSWSGFQRHG